MSICLFFILLISYTLVLYGSCYVSLPLSHGLMCFYTFPLTWLNHCLLAVYGCIYGNEKLQQIALLRIKKSRLKLKHVPLLMGVKIYGIKRSLLLNSLASLYRHMKHMSGDSERGFTQVLSLYKHPFVVHGWVPRQLVGLAGVRNSWQAGTLSDLWAPETDLSVISPPAIIWTRAFYFYTSLTAVVPLCTVTV